MVRTVVAPEPIEDEPKPAPKVPSLIDAIKDILPELYNLIDGTGEYKNYPSRVVTSNLERCTYNLRAALKQWELSK